jgi:hypothetical protein
MVKFTTPKVLRVLQLAGIVCTAVLFVVVRAGYQQNQHSAEVIGQKATSGIVAAQKLKVELTRMHASFAKQIVSPQQDEELARQFAEARKDVSLSLVEASKNIHFGAAETVPIKRIQYVLPIYQSVVTDALEARASGNSALATSKAVEAHTLMTEQLLVAADQLDEANTTAMNRAYDEQVTANQKVDTQVLVAGLVLVGFLAAIQFYLFRKFRRLVNPGLAVATLLTLGFTLYANHQFDSANSHLKQAKEDVFQRLHVMWRAEARVEQARAALLFKLLPGERGAQFDRELRESRGRVLSLPAGMSAQEFAQQTLSARVSAEPTGYLAILAREKGSVDDSKALALTIERFGDFATAARPNQSEGAAAQLLSELGQAKKANDSAFKSHASGAFSALRSLDVYALVIALLVAALCFFGVQVRLREYAV